MSSTVTQKPTGVVMECLLETDSIQTVFYIWANKTYGNTTEGD